MEIGIWVINRVISIQSMIFSRRSIVVLVSRGLSVVHLIRRGLSVVHLIRRGLTIVVLAVWIWASLMVHKDLIISSVLPLSYPLTSASVLESQDDHRDKSDKEKSSRDPAKDIK